MKTSRTQLWIVALLTLLPVTAARAAGTEVGLGFSVESIGSPASGQVALAGGGTYDPGDGRIEVGGPVRCLADIRQGPLAGCRAGEVLRWRAAAMVPTANCDCAAGAEATNAAAMIARTDRRTVVMTARLFREGEDDHPLYTALLIVSSRDQDPDRPGRQNAWLEGVGCGSAMVTFR